MKIICSGYASDLGKGIYQLNLTAEKVSDLRLLAQINSPTYLQYDQKTHLLFSIDKNDGKTGGISSFFYDGHHLKKADSLLTPGAAPAYIGINSSKHLLYTANYHTGVIAVLNYNSQGKLQLVAQLKQEANSLGFRKEQEAPHPHFFDETPSGDLACCDLGNDSVSFYSLSGHDLTLKVRYHSETGLGDRHLVFNKSGNLFYVLGELASKIEEVEIKENWQFQKQYAWSSISDSYQGHNGAAAIKISHDGRFLYASNRGSDTICVYQIKKDQKPALIQRISTFGSFPRDFNWNSKENYVATVNQNSNNLTLYRRNHESGCLTPLQKNIFVPKATRVLFIEED